MTTASTMKGGGARDGSSVVDVDLSRAAGRLCHGWSRPHQCNGIVTDGEHDRQGQVGRAPSHRALQPRSQRGEHRTCETRHQCQCRQGAQTASASPSGQRRKGRRIEHGRHRHTRGHPRHQEHRPGRRSGDQDDGGHSHDRSAGHDPTRAASVEPAADEDATHSGHDQAGRERGGEEHRAPAGVVGHRTKQHGEGVVEHAPAGDLGDRQDPQHAPQPGACQCSIF